MEQSLRKSGGILLAEPLTRILRLDAISSAGCDDLSSKNAVYCRFFEAIQAVSTAAMLAMINR
jgi:hypothetical protein